MPGEHILAILAASATGFTVAAGVGLLLRLF
jgi:hypothetical protein